jgi:hypothetical protein
MHLLVRLNRTQLSCLQDCSISCQAYQPLTSTWSSWIVYCRRRCHTIRYTSVFLDCAVALQPGR